MLNLEMLLQMFEDCGSSVVGSTKILVVNTPKNISVKTLNSLLLSKYAEPNVWYHVKIEHSDFFIFFLLVLNQHFGLVCNTLYVMQIEGQQCFSQMKGKIQSSCS